MSREWWDGKTQGKPPTIYNAASVLLRDLQNIPPAWKQRGVFIGTLRVTRDPASWPDEGIVSLHDAVRAGIGQGKSRLRVDSGPFLPVPEEAVILAGLVFLAFRSVRSKNKAQQLEQTTGREVKR